jgi:hypothetical protein
VTEIPTRADYAGHDISLWSFRARPFRRWPSITVPTVNLVEGGREGVAMATFTKPEELQGADFADADLRGVRFVRADLSGVTMRGVEVSGADIDAPWLVDGDTWSSTAST